MHQGQLILRPACLDARVRVFRAGFGRSAQPCWPHRSGSRLRSSFKPTNHEPHSVFFWIQFMGPPTHSGSNKSLRPTKQTGAHTAPSVWPNHPAPAKVKWLTLLQPSVFALSTSPCACCYRPCGLAPIQRVYTSSLRTCPPSPLPAGPPPSACDARTGIAHGHAVPNLHSPGTASVTRLPLLVPFARRSCGSHS